MLWVVGCGLCWMLDLGVVLVSSYHEDNSPRTYASIILQCGSGNHHSMWTSLFLRGGRGNHAPSRVDSLS